MHKNRLEAFSDGVIAIIITIMVLELKVPLGHEWADLWTKWPIFVSYVMSFVYVGIYWNNHHHMTQSIDHIDGRILWANLILLFGLSLLPFASGWVGESHFAAIPSALYGAVLLFAALAYTLLTRTIMAHGQNHRFKAAIGADIKGKISIFLYIVGLVLSVLNLPVWGNIIYGLVALMWLIPDKRLEKVILES